MHELGPEPNFNASMSLNGYDPETRLGAFFRLGNRANEGTGEMTICLYLPDGRVAFMFSRPRVTTNEAFDAAGMRFEVVKPFAELQVSYEGSVVLLADPLETANPISPQSARARSSPGATTSSWWRRVARCRWETNGGSSPVTDCATTAGVRSEEHTS